MSPRTVSVRALSELITKGTTPTSIGRNFTANGVRFLKVETFEEDGTYVVGKEAFIDEETHRQLSRSQLADGDLLFSIAGALGRSTMVESDWLPANTNQALAIIRPSKKSGLVQPRYLLWALRSPTVGKRIDEINVQAAQANLSLQQVGEFEIPIPNMAEQEAIAAALDDVDALVKSLKRLVAKKRDVKQGMMQELLTGRTRLPGFAGGWSAVRLGDVLSVRHGRDQKAVEVADGRYKILATGGQIGTTNTPLYSKPSVLIGRKGTIDRPQFRNEPFWSVDTLFYTEIRDRADPKYLFYVFQTVDWRSMNEASGVPSLTSGRVESVEVNLPTLDEQRAIRAVLDDADGEISALERRLESARAVKVGMMQELLTGRTRLPMKEEE